MKGGKHRKLVALLSSGTFIMCDVFLVIISAKECQTDVRTKVGTILLCSFVFTVLRALPLPHWKVFDNFLTSFWLLPYQMTNQNA